MSLVDVDKPAEVVLAEKDIRKSCCRQISATKSIDDVEANIFKCLASPIERYFVNIQDENVKIWTISANTKSKNTPIVLIHGFCGGVGLWVHNIDALSKSRPFYAFDLLGFARSSRPEFPKDPVKAEELFIQSIEDWRKALGLKEIIVLGHSFGGYLSAAYAIKYPDIVKALLLVDPWGFPETPESRSFKPKPLLIRAIAKLSQHVNPLSIIRNVSDEKGVSLIKRFRPDFREKFMNILENPDIIYDYIYLSNKEKPSGEIGFTVISKYFGYAKNPMIRRITEIDNKLPVFFIYGKNSWIDSSSGYLTIELRGNPALTSVKLIDDAGHHVYCDNADEFNDYVRELLEDLN